MGISLHLSGARSRPNAVGEMQAVSCKVRGTTRLPGMVWFVLHGHIAAREQHLDTHVQERGLHGVLLELAHTQRPPCCWMLVFYINVLVHPCREDWQVAPGWSCPEEEMAGPCCSLTNQSYRASDAAGVKHNTGHFLQDVLAGHHG